MVEATGSTQTLVSAYWTTRRHIPEDHCLQISINILFTAISGFQQIIRDGVGS
jgi:hypothetical protein